ncbi:alpha/beta fold hydrolase [Psychrobacillus sp. OK032]|uniref:alpha/beta fold hydrolase n=1 Tax=Psychrobacillus sp. OK032 TaxID=1884358 RepID=UPI0008C5A2F7|nr:alpha/beta hydrolase [Psychrobacillus sp. OK032]SES29982.1 Pimeloyl-ACP methyl ester carboxylesterase [Psychrobacillus sp. OK032]
MNIQVNQADVAYKEEGNGEPILLIHGFCGSSDYWSGVIQELAQTYRVIALDLPGHGDSAVQEDVNEIEHYATFIKDFLDELKIDQVTMFGHSLGGYITLAFAEKYSNRLKGFSLIHSTGFPDSEEAKKGREISANNIDTEGMEAFIEGLVPKLFSSNHLESHSKEITEVKKIGFSTSLAGAKNALIAMKNRTDRREIIEITDLPVLLIAGEEDQLIPPDKVFTANGKHLKQVLINDVGHMSMYEAPKELIRAIIDFK